MAELFCCSAIKPYRPQRLDHEAKFDRFMQWAKYASSEPSDSFHLNSNLEYAVQLVKQVNFGRQESIRFFTPAKDSSGFLEITESNLLEANFEKLNSCVSKHASSLFIILIKNMPCYQVQELQMQLTQQVFRSQLVPEESHQQAPLASESCTTLHRYRLAIEAES